MSKETEKRARRVVKSLQPKLANIATEMILPNNSGDHVRSIKRAAPINGVDLVNKDYVDSLTANHPHQDVTTTASPSFTGYHLGDNEKGYYGDGNDGSIYYAGDIYAGFYLNFDSRETGAREADFGFLNGAIRGIDGAYNHPTFGFISDPLTGIYLQDTYTLGFVCGETVQLLLSPTQADFRNNNITTTGTLHSDGNITTGGTVDGIDIAGMSGFVVLNSGHRNGDGSDHADVAANTTASHAESHDIASHSDTTATGTELNTLTDDSMADTLHRHSELSASDGTPDQVIHVDAAGLTHIDTAGAGAGEAIVLELGNEAFSGNMQTSINFEIDTNGGAERSGARISQRQTGATKGELHFKVDNAGLKTVLSIIPEKVGVGTLIPDEKFSVMNKFLTTSTGDTYWKDAGSGLPYGDMYVHENTTGQTISTATLTQVTTFDTNGVSNLTTPDHTNDHITISKTGKYLINLSSAFSGDPNVTWKGGVYKNNGATKLSNLQTERKLGAGGDVGSISISGIAALTAADTIEVWFEQSEGVDKSITVKELTLSVVMVGG